MTDPIEKQRPLLVWGTDREDVMRAKIACGNAGLRCSLLLTGEHYSLFCAYLTESIDPDLDAQLRALVSHVQVSLSRT